MDQNSGGDKTLKWFGIGCGTALVLAFCCFAMMVGAIIWLASLTPDEKVQVNVNTPINLEQGRAFEMTITVTNISDQPIELDSIDISDSYLSGFIIRSATPRYNSVDQFDGVGGDSYQTYYFGTMIPPGESLPVTFSGETVLSGDFSGNIDVCIDSIFTCTTNFVRTIIE